MTEPETTCKGFEVNHLVKQYANADKPVLDDISFKVEHGSVLVVLGPSGSGKSTLLRGLSRLLKPRGGEVVLDGKAISTYRTKEVARIVGLLPQSSTAPEGITVADLLISVQPGNNYMI